MAINRRQFLQGLAGLGATIAIPVSIADWSDPEVDEAWERAIAEPYEFEVDEFGSISTPGWELPDTNGEAYGIDLDGWSSGDDLVELAGWATGLAFALECHFQSRAYDAADLLSKAGPAALSGEDQRVLKLHQKFGDGGWADWLRRAPQPDLKSAADAMQEWLDDYFDSNDLEQACLQIGPYVEPYAFFSGLEEDELQTLGVRIVDGDRPGSSYFAAELHEDLDEANRAAAESGIPVRFRSG